MEYFKEDYFYILIKEKDMDCVISYCAKLGSRQAEDSFMFGLQEGFINKKLVLGVEIEGMKIPVFQCNQGRFSIPDECDKDGLPESVKEVLFRLILRCGISGETSVPEMQSYDIRITETLSKIVTVKTGCMEKALLKARDNYESAMPEYILASEELQEVTISMAGIHQKKHGNRETKQEMYFERR